MIAGFNGHVHRDSKTHPVLIDQRHASLNNPVTLQALNALPTGGGRQSNPVANLGDRKRSVFLQDSQYFSIDSIHKKNLSTTAVELSLARIIFQIKWNYLPNRPAGWDLARV